ncbi:hypothetical protein CTEN210_14873 [Chaetoceros tenuissimus]|uniref:Uncharacterized protein n=1 Tax=Chaetoceros tenuissimus TaxID=426638 RepID=A0AAD3HC53_9STRA|nr:hypothetical protein CTEN210_14873 [Chaetoceros tenuissimus]
MNRNRFTPLGLLQSMKEGRDIDEEDDTLFYKSIKRSRKRRKSHKNKPGRKRPRSSHPTSSSTSTNEKISGYMYVLDNGKIRLGTPYDSLWWINYVLLPPEKLNARQRMKFRHRYRMPYETWKDFVEVLNSAPLLRKWHKGSVDCIGQRSSPIELLSLGALKYLGRKCTFDCLEELTFISERTHERFFKKFIEFGESTLYTKYVITPTNHIELQMQLDMMKSAGFPGCCASSDATHVMLENVRFGLRQIHKGWKLNKTARSYNISVTHTRRILSSTSGHPSRWNDQSIAWFDDFLVSMRNGELLEDYQFEL